MSGQQNMANQVLSPGERTSAHYAGSAETGSEALAAAIAHLGGPSLSAETQAVLQAFADMPATIDAGPRASARCARTRCANSSRPRPTTRSVGARVATRCVFRSRSATLDPETLQRVPTRTLTPPECGRWTRMPSSA